MSISSVLAEMLSSIESDLKFITYRDHKLLSDLADGVINPTLVVLSGGEDFGSYAERDRYETRLAELCIAKEIPLVGICRGMLVIGKVFGFDLAPIEGHVGTLHKICFLDSGESAIVNSYHNWVLQGYSPSINILAFDEAGNIEALKHREKPIECWMWHPERDNGIRDKIMRRISVLIGVN